MAKLPEGRSTLTDKQMIDLTHRLVDTCIDCKGRIEELEAKLAKVTDVALRLYYGSGVVTGDMHATLAELAWKQYGGKDE